MNNFTVTVYVLTVLKDGILDSCEVFEKQDHAINSGVYFCQTNNITSASNLTFDNKMQGWFLAEDRGYFITVVKRQKRLDNYVPNDSYAVMMDTITGKNSSKPLDLINEIISDANLPGGFSLDGKALTMHEMLEDPYDCMRLEDLSQDQLWGLVMARVKRQPEKMFKTSSFTYNQKQILHELNKGLSLSRQIVEQEKDVLEEFYDRIFDLSSEDESSSSWDGDN